LSSELPELICPFCFTLFPAGVLEEEVPLCRECNGLGRAIITEPLKEFLGSVSLIELENIRSSWTERMDNWQVERERILANLDIITQKYYPR